MPWMETYDPARLRRETEKAMSLPLGLASPLWLAFGAAATAGVAWWWLSRLGRPVNIEAVGERLPVPVDAALAAPEAALEIVAEAEAETALVAEAAADDLTRLAGVGPRIAEALAARGVASFEALAAWTEDQVAAFDQELNLRGRALRSDWIGQAKALLGQAAASA